MHRGKISDILSIITAVILIITLYLNNLIQTFAPLMFYLGNATVLLAIIFLIVGSFRAFIVDLTSVDYDDTQKYFIGGIVFIGLTTVV